MITNNHPLATKTIPTTGPMNLDNFLIMGLVVSLGGILFLNSETFNKFYFNRNRKKYKVPESSPEFKKFLKKKEYAPHLSVSKYNRRKYEIITKKVHRDRLNRKKLKASKR